MLGERADKASATRRVNLRSTLKKHLTQGQALLLATLDTQLLVGLRGHPQIWLQLFVALGKELVRVFIRDRRQNDNVVAVLPVRGRRDLLVVRKL